MSRRLLSPSLGMVTGAVLPLLLFLYLRRDAAIDPLIALPVGHFYVVSAVSLLAAVAAVMAGIAGIRLRNIQVIFLSVAFSSLALVFALHGLSTPGFLLPVTQVPGMAAQLSIVLTSFWLWLSACPPDHFLVKPLARWWQWLVPVWVGFLVVMVIVTMRSPEIVRILPIHLSPLKWTTTAIVLFLNLMTVRRYWASYRYSQLPLQHAILYSIGWIAGAQIIMATAELWRTSWWIYHFLLLSAMVIMLSGLLRQYASGASLGLAVKGLMGLDPMERIEVGISPSFRALVIAAETRDRYTGGHSYRVAIEAVRLGEAMGLAPELLRALAQAGVVHDVGKIQVPDQILNKPGRLSAEERAIVEQHPVIGFEVCKRIGFLREELGAIRHHHEKWDGTGYPDGLAGNQIPLLARVMAVADVYDALTSKRAYRPAWSHDRALAHIREQAGHHFDPECVAAWVQISAVAPQVTYPPWLRPDLEDGSPAALSKGPTVSEPLVAKVGAGRKLPK